MTATLSARDAYVQQLRAANVAPDAVEREADRKFGRVVLSAAERAQHERDARVLEKTEQLEVTKRFRVCGFTAYNLSQARASKQTPGLADLWLVHQSLPIALWWETKRQVGGKHSDAQLAFRSECERCGVGYGTGDRYDAERYLIATGRAWISAAGSFEPITTTGA